MARSRFAALVAILLGLYALFDMAVFYPTSGQRFLYAAATAPVFLGAIVAFRRAELSRRGWRIVCTIVGIALLPVAAVFYQNTIIPHYVLGDVATMLLPAAALVLGAAAPELFRSRLALGSVCGLLVLASVLAPFFGRAETGRFISPPLLLLAFTWAVALQTKPSQLRSWARVLACVLGLLVVLSATRSTMVLYALLGIGASVAHSGPIRGLRNGLLGSAVFYATTFLVPPDQVEQILRSLRVEDLSQGVADQSVQTRIDEVVDVFANIRDFWTPGNWLLGSGPGATWMIYDAAPNPNNVLADGSVHQIHCTPVLLLWRAGLLGFGGYVALTLFSILQVARNRSTSSPIAIAFRLAALAYLIDAGVRVVFADPLCSFAIGGMLFWSECREDQASSGEPCRTMTPSSK